MKYFKLKRLRHKMRYWSWSHNKGVLYVHVASFNAPRWCVAIRLQHWMCWLDLFGFELTVAIHQDKKEKD